MQRRNKMFRWFKELFEKCEHEFEFTRTPVRLKRWVEDDDVPMYASESYCIEHSHWEYSNAIKVIGRCKKCGKSRVNFE